jgi:hypothetical protein
MMVTIDRGIPEADVSEVRIRWNEMRANDEEKGKEVQLKMVATDEGLALDVVNFEGEVIATTVLDMGILMDVAGLRNW